MWYAHFYNCTHYIFGYILRLYKRYLSLIKPYICIINHLMHFCRSTKTIVSKIEAHPTDVIFVIQPHVLMNWLPIVSHINGVIAGTQ